MKYNNIKYRFYGPYHVLEYYNYDTLIKTKYCTVDDGYVGTDMYINGDIISYGSIEEE